jgi:hypothetical protein
MLFEFNKKLKSPPPLFSLQGPVEPRQRCPCRTRRGQLGEQRARFADAARAPRRIGEHLPQHVALRMACSQAHDFAAYRIERIDRLAPFAAPARKHRLRRRDRHRGVV